MSIFDLTDKIAIVIGGSGGIGHTLAVALAKAGADVVVSSRRLDKLEPVAEEIHALGKKSLAVSVDVTQEQSVADMVTHVLKEFPRIDILVNTAGLIIRKPAESIPIDEWQKVMDVNARGTFICCQAVAQTMIKRHAGKIINMSSVRGAYGDLLGAVAYSPSKGAINILTKTLACEWAKYNILVNAIAPTIVETDLTRGALTDPAFAQRIKARIPLGRWAKPEDIVGPTLFLASNASDFITGQIIYVEGGTTTW